MHSTLQFLAGIAATWCTVTSATPIDVQRTDMTLANPLLKRDAYKVACGVWSTADVRDFDYVVAELSNKGGVARAEARSCTRLGCYDTTGAYLCNDQDVPLELEIKPLVDTAGILLKRVCSTGSGGGFSGQVFYADNGGWNFVGSYCNGNDPTNIPPSGYTPPGPNGDPQIDCGDACELPAEECSDDSIVVTETNYVVCNDYMTLTPVTAGETYTISTTKTISTGFTVGGNLGLNFGKLKSPLGNFGFTGSYTETVTTGTSVGIAEECGAGNTGEGGRPGNWTCVAHIQPRCVETKGTCSAGVLGIVPYVAQIPLNEPGSGTPAQSQSLCVCQNCPGLAENGAPQDVCPRDCEICY